MEKFKYPIHDYSKNEKRGCWPVILCSILFWSSIIYLLYDWLAN
jgi:hypothetical protein